MKRTLSTVLAAMTFFWAVGLTGPANAVTVENPIATAAKFALDGARPDSPPAANRVPAATTLNFSDSPTGFRSEALTRLATEIATVVPIDTDELLTAWQTTSPQRLRVMLTALSQVGTPYRYGGNAPGGFDCSGLTSFAWASVGVRLPRTSSLQIEQAAPRELTELRAGDVLWRPGHIGMSLGVPDVMVNATQTGRPVEVKRWGKIHRAGSPIEDQ